MTSNANEQQALKDEWARMQGMGRRLQKARMIATLAGMGIVFGGFVVSAIVYFAWPANRIPIWILALPVVFAISVGWGVRNKLWPKGQFA